MKVIYLQNQTKVKKLLDDGFALRSIHYYRIKKLLLLSLIFPMITLRANVTLPHVLSDNMVLQRDRAVKVWGWADHSEKVSVSFNGQRVFVKTGAEGKWMVELKPMKFGGPFEMKIKGNNEIILKNILIGDVWLCSGQSNMEFTVINSNNALKEIETANYADIRCMTIAKEMGDVPMEDVEGNWKVCNPTSVGSFSAVGYYFVRNLYKHLKIPQGLISSSWGGTNVEAWMSIDAFNNKENVNEKLSAIKNIDQKMAQMKKINEAWLNQLEQQDTGLKMSYEKTTDFSYWNQLKVPGIMEKQIGDFDGVIWVGQIFMLTAQETKSPISVSLGEIDDNDKTYINGQLVGTTKGCNLRRIYTVPVSLLKVGMNIMIIRIEDTGGNAGLTSDESVISLNTSNGKKMLAGYWYYKMGIKLENKNGNYLSPNDYPTTLYNAMINPFINYQIKGVIWYQGESNANNPKAYNLNFPSMITDWRNKWGEGDFSFFFVQLANFITGPGNDWPGLRESQTNTLKLLNTGMAVTTDIGNPNDIHPRNKQDVGYRLSLCARNITYGEPVEYMGPLYKSIVFENDKAKITFDHIGSGLKIKDRYGYLHGFSIAGKDGNFQWAKAEIKDNKVIVWCDKVTEPMAVRYAWEDNPQDANLYNNEDLPASAFRTDQ